MSTRWQREAEKGNQAAVQYRENLTKEGLKSLESPHPITAGFSTLERRALNRMIQSNGTADMSYFAELARQERLQRNTEAKEASTYLPMTQEQFLSGIRALDPLQGFRVPRDSLQNRLWGEWAEKLEAHDRDTRAYKNNEFIPSAQPFPRERLLTSDPGWGKVVSRDHRSAQPVRNPDMARSVIETEGRAAASEERAPEAKALFAALLEAPPTVTMTACTCGKIGANVCVPVQVTLDKRSKFLAMKGSNQKYLSKEDHKALSDHRKAAGKSSDAHGLDWLPPSELAIVDTYE